MVESPGLAVFVLAVIIFVGWYAVGTQLNVRRGHEAMKWLQKGLPSVGERAALRWLGSSVVELKLAKAKDPDRSAEVLVVLEPRDVPLMWWWTHSKGRRDLLIFRAQLRSAPDFEVEARKMNTWGAPNLQKATPKWTAVQGGVASEMSADYRGNISPYSINPLIVAASQEGMTLTRLAVRRSPPNLEVQYLLPDLKLVPAQRVFNGLRHLSEEVLKL